MTVVALGDLKFACREGFFFRNAKFCSEEESFPYTYIL